MEFACLVNHIMSKFKDKKINTLRKRIVFIVFVVDKFEEKMSITWVTLWTYTYWKEKYAISYAFS